MDSLVASILIPILTFLVGLLVGLFYKYSDIAETKVKVKHLEDQVNAVNIAELMSSLKIMKESVIFTPAFQRELVTICSEHERMRSQIEVNTVAIAEMKAKEQK
jgi:predicted histidine transporter YuiF (NhaC family)